MSGGHTRAPGPDLGASDPGVTCGSPAVEPGTHGP